MVTDPAGATATADGGQIIVTPGTLVVPAGAADMEIRIEKEGYEPETVLRSQPAQDPNAFKNCVDGRTLNPGAPPPQVSGASDGLNIGLAAFFALAGCAPPPRVMLEPGMVFVKLVPLPALPVRRSAPVVED